MEKYTEEIKREFSGVNHTSDICDVCNSKLEEGDIVYVHVEKSSGTWKATSTSCSDCEDHLDDRELIEAIVECELGPKRKGQYHPLYNAKILELNTEGGKEIRKDFQKT